MNVAEPTERGLWALAKRTETMNSSAIREILKLTEASTIISFAGGLPSPKTFPVAEVQTALNKVLSTDGIAALQYGASEGYLPLREAIAGSLSWPVGVDQVLITTGSQQGLDLLGKALIDTGSVIWVESPTYLGALQAFGVMQPRVVSLACDAQGLDIAKLQERLERTKPADFPRFLYLLPNFQNPTGRTLSLEHRARLVTLARQHGLCLIEDNPYGDLWYESPPAPPLAASYPEGVVYLGSFSKVLAPGLRLGYAVLPASLYPKVLQAKQAADLHTPSLNQRLLHELLQSRLIEKHKPSIRALYQSQAQAMLAALARTMPSGVTWTKPTGGMFLWLTLAAHIDATALLPQAIARGVAFVPGAFFYATAAIAERNTLRLSFVTASITQIDHGIAVLAQLIREQLR